MCFETTTKPGDPHEKHQDRIPRLLRPTALAATLVLAACGGGGDGPADQTLTLSGTAAEGAAIQSAPVSAKCTSGTGNATSRADGGFDVTVSGGALPCVLRVTAADGTVLQWVATGTGSSARANISPLTDLAVAHLMGADPATLWDNFEPSRVSSEALATAVSVVLAMIESVGGDTGAVSNPFTAALVPPSGSSPGNAYDQALELLTDALISAGVSLETLREQVVPVRPATRLATPPTPSVCRPNCCWRPRPPTAPASLPGGTAFWVRRVLAPTSPIGRGLTPALWPCVRNLTTGQHPRLCS